LYDLLSLSAHPVLALWLSDETNPMVLCVKYADYSNSLDPYGTWPKTRNQTQSRLAIPCATDAIDQSSLIVTIDRTLQLNGRRKP
jgi:hypothetical protein